MVASSRLGSGAAHDRQPLLMVDFSDDGGKTWRGERMARLGAQGVYDTSVRLNRWGRVKEKGRIWRLRASAKVLKGINGMSLDARPCG